MRSDEASEALDVREPEAGAKDVMEVFVVEDLRFSDEAAVVDDEPLPIEATPWEGEEER